MPSFKSINSSSVPLDGTHLVAVRGLTTKRCSTQERQREQLVGAALLRPIRTNRSCLTCRCQFPDSRKKKLDYSSLLIFSIFSLLVGLLSGRLTSYINLYHLFADPYISHRFLSSSRLPGVFVFGGEI